MKIVLVGANGTIGKKVHELLFAEGHEIVKVGKTSGDFQVDIADRESVRRLYAKIGAFDAVANASGEVAFAPFEKLGAAEWGLSLGSKLMGQVHLVQEALPYIREKGSFTLISGIVGDDPIFSGVAAAAVNRAIEGFVIAAANELPKGLRINVVSPTLLVESLKEFGPFFPGYTPVEGTQVAQAYKKSIFGNRTGQKYTLYP
ncbi:MAG: short chain dehydrogenase [Bdellovibrionales bacterium]|nr:short chain dehydrogenase [Bdellovibrionales bacterium]